MAAVNYAIYPEPNWDKLYLISKTIIRFHFVCYFSFAGKILSNFTIVDGTYSNNVYFLTGGADFDTKHLPIK